MEKCEALALLDKTNTKKTEARSKILDTILSCTEPITANQLHKMLTTESGIDLATVYRALKTFTEKELVRVIHIDGETSYFEKACKHNPLHAHFHCEACGAIECLLPYGFEESSALIRMAEGKKISSIDLVIKGRCSKCA